MSNSNETCFLPSKNLMSDGSICFVNFSVVVIVAKIVSPGWVSLCWKFRVGVAVAVEIRNKNRNNVVYLIYRGGFGC